MATLRLKRVGKAWNIQLNIWYQLNSIYIECMEYISPEKIHIRSFFLSFAWIVWVKSMCGLDELSDCFYRFFSLSFGIREFFVFVFSSLISCYCLPKTTGDALKNGWTSNVRQSKNAPETSKQWQSNEKILNVLFSLILYRYMCGWLCLCIESKFVFYITTINRSVSQQAKRKLDNTNDFWALFCVCVYSPSKH